MVGRIHSDIFFQQRYMLNEVNTKIRLTRSKDTFSLMCAGANTYRVVIVSAALFVRKVKISSSVYLAHAKTLEKGWPSTRFVVSSVNRLRFRPVIWM